MKKLFLLLLTTFIINNTYGQSMELNFPHFAEQQWYMTGFRGDGKDTISTGWLDKQGKTTIDLSRQYKNYRGMVQWFLSEGGGLNIILGGEDSFSVSCTEAQPSNENILYTGSSENTYLNPRYYRQQAILGKIDAMHMATEAYATAPLSSPKEMGSYKENEELLSIFNLELQKQEELYNRLQEETATNQLYAARFAQVVDIVYGLPPVLPLGNEDLDKQLKDFVLNNLDMNVLYTSGHWSGILAQFLEWYTSNEKNRIHFIPDVIYLLNRIDSDEVYTALAEKVIAMSEKKDLRDEEIELAFFLLNDDRIKEPSGKIASLYTLLKIRKGEKAPALVQGKLSGKKSILVFYDSSCGNCTAQMSQLVELYPKLKKQGYEVLSFSADSDKEMFTNYAAKLPWADKYCDFEGFAGKDFLNYGIMGTPTFYILDANNTVQGRYARVKDMNLLN